MSQVELAGRILTCRGEWNFKHLAQIQRELTHIVLPTTGQITIDGQHISNMDSAGAWFLASFIEQCKKRNLTVERHPFSPQQETLLKLVDKNIALTETPPTVQRPRAFARFGMQSVDCLWASIRYFEFIGKLTYEYLRVIHSPRKWRLAEIAGVVFRTGCQALPIIAMLSFMIGVVITYQMGLQLRNYGANIYIVNLLGLAILREFAPLMTAIMVAGRTGSAFTAQLGMMKINQEIDALNTMGVTPAELLLLPRIIGLFIALPLLTFWSDIFGVIGGIVMSNNMLDITWYEFLHRFPRVIPLKNLFIGLSKAPLFALIIASVGCFQGMEVKENVNHIGLNTTRSVVLSIFFIIFSKLKI